MKEELIETENREEEKTEQAPATVPAETDGKLPLPGKARRPCARKTAGCSPRLRRKTARSARSRGKWKP